MPLLTKSITKPREASDGIRVCVMRGPRDGDDYDIWMPVLAPSRALLDDYFGKKIDWTGYCERFDKEILQGKRDYLQLLIEMATKHAVTILCLEDTPEQCHRRLLVEECKRIDPTLEVIIK
jgi:uncharacterized protein YeaO (DUF488 family)